MAWYHNYYQEQFGNRVGNVVKRGAAPPPPGNTGGSGGGRGAGFAIFLVIALVVGLFRGLSRPSPRYEPPRFDPPRFDMPNIDPQIEAPLPGLRHLKPEERERVRRALEEAGKARRPLRFKDQPRPRLGDPELPDLPDPDRPDD